MSFSKPLNSASETNTMEGNVDDQSQQGLVLGRPVLLSEFQNIVPNTPINIGCIAAPTCSNNKLFDYLTSGKLCDYWKGVKFDKDLPHRTILDRLLEIYFDPGFVSQVSDRALFGLLEQQVISNVPIPHDEDLNKKYNYQQLFYSARSIAFIMNNCKGTPEIVAYQRLCAEITKLSFLDQGLMIRSISMVFGPIQYLASNVTNRNISYIMKKLKLTTSLKLLHELFVNPSVVGKCGAIWQLLEIHEIVWMDIDWSILQDIVKYCYDTISWLFESAKAFGGKLADGFEWVAAKFKSSPDDNEVYVDAFEDLPVEDPTPEEPVKQAESEKEVFICRSCEERPAFGCYNCKIHWCQKHEEGVCCGVLNKHVYFEDCCKSIANNDCWWRAIANALGSSVADVKKSVKEFAETPEVRDTLLANLKKIGYEQDLDEMLANMNEQMKVQEMAEIDSVLFTQMWCHRPIYIREGVSLLHQEIPHVSWAINEPIYIEHANLHYEFIPDYDDYCETNGKSYACMSLYGRQFKCMKHTTRKPSPHGSASDLAQKLAQQLADEKNLGKKVKDNKNKPKPTGGTNVAKSEASRLLSRFDMTKTGAKMKSWFSRAFENAVDFFSDNPVIGALFSLAAGICTFLGFTIPFLNGDVEKDGLIMRFTNATRSIYYAQKGTEGIFTAFKETIKAMKDVMGISNDSKVQDFKEKVAEILKLSNELLRVAQVNPAQFINDASKYVEFRKAYEGIMNTYVTLSRLSHKDDIRTIQPIWYPLNKNFEKLTDIYNKFLAGLSDRQVPVAIWLWGETDIGKSQLCNYLIDKVNEKSKRPDLKTFTVSKGPAFWNTYSQQAHIKMDDFNAVITNEGDVDAMTFFNLITNAAFNPNQAAIQDKNTMANPLFVWVNSNFASVPLNTSIQNISAFERRRHVFVNVSWPEHASCPRGEHSCEHWDGKTVNDFSHLTLTVCRPDVTDAHQSSEEGTVLFQRPDGELVRDGQKISINEVVDLILDKEAEHHQVFCDSIARKQKMGSLDFAVTPQANAEWSTLPTVILQGPPGTGKSHIFSDVRDSLKAKNLTVRHIISTDDFDKFGDSDFVDVNADCVIVDDMSSHLNSKHFMKFFNHVTGRYNAKDADTKMLMIGINHGPFYQRCLKEMCDENYHLFYRRATIVQTWFRKKDGLRNFFKKDRYTYEDTKHVADPKLMDKFVSYQFEQLRCTQQSVVNRLTKMKAKIEEVEYQAEMEDRLTVDASIVCETAYTSEKFAVLLNEMTGREIINIIVGGACTIRSRNLAYGKVIQILMRTLQNCRYARGSEFADFDDFMLQVANAGFANEFRGEVVVFKFSDKAYFIDITGEKTRVGTVTDHARLINEAIFATKDLINTVSSADLIKAYSAALPPWFMLCGDVIHKVFAMSMTAIFATTGILQQEQIFKDHKRADKIRVGIIGSAESAVDNYLDDFVEKLNPKRNIKSVPRFADIDQDDPLKRASKEESPDKFKKPDPRKEESPDKFKKPDPRKEEDRPTPVPKKIWNNPPDGVKSEYLDRPFNAKVNRTGPIKEKEKFIEYAWPQVRKDKAITEMVTDPTMPQIMSVVASNMCSIETLTGQFLCSGLFIKDKLLTTVHHVLTTAKVENLRVRDVDNNVWRVKIVKEVENVDRLDLAVDDKTFPNQRDIRHHFTTRDMSIPFNTPAVLVSSTRRIINGKLVVYLRAFLAKSQTMVCYMGETKKRMLLEYQGHKIGYSITGVQTQGGDCGSILIVVDPTWQGGKVIAMHTAATRTTAFGRMMLRENYEDVGPLSELAITIRSPCPPTLRSDYFAGAYKNDEGIIGYSKVRQHVGGFTKLYRNLYPVGPRLYEPCVLSKYDPRNPGCSPLHDECMKWVKRRPELPESIKALARRTIVELGEAYADVLQNQGVTLHILTKTEALNRLMGCPTSEPLNVRTSAGTPWRDMSQAIGKNGFIGIDSNGVHRFKDNPEVNALHASMDGLIQEHKRTHKQSVIFLACMKDETVKLKKIYNGAPRTRTLAASPLDFSVVYRMYLHAAQAWMASNWQHLPPKIGINPLGYDWNFLFMSLAKVSLHGIDLDFEGWDFSHDPYMVMLLAEFWIIIYQRLCPGFTQDDAEVIRTLYSKIAEFQLLVGETVYKTTGGIPSGYSGTAPDNSVFGDWISYMVYCMIFMTVNPKLCTLRSYREDVGSAHYGDDTLFSLSEYVKDHFNGVTVVPHFAKLGFKATSATKEASSIPFKPLLDCTFLSRKFARMGSIIVGPLTEDRLYRPTWWVRGSPSRLYWKEPDRVLENGTTVLSAYDSCLNEAALHSDEIFNLVWEAASKAANDFGEVLPPRRQDYLIRMFGLADSQELEDHGLTVYDEKLLLELNVNPPRDLMLKFHNRSTVHFGDKYRYQGAVHLSRRIPPDLLKLLEILNYKYNKKWNSILMNIYKKGGQIPFHKDDEPEVDQSEGVGCFTLKGDGCIHIQNSRLSFKVDLRPGDFYIMNEDCLNNFFHKRDCHQAGETVSLTFRRMITSQ